MKLRAQNLSFLTIFITFARNITHTMSIKSILHSLLCLLFLTASLSLSARRLTPAEVPAAQDRAWQAWRAQVAADRSFYLPALQPLASAAPGEVQIPAQLEPDATMQFFYGAKGARPEAGYPLFLYLHGSGSPDDEWNGGRQWALQFADAPSVYFIPRIPRTGPWYRWYQASKQWAWEKLLQHALASPDIDPLRLYVFGISEGGYGSQRLASYYADYWAAAGPMAGGEPLMNAPVDNCEHIGFSLLTGQFDTQFCRDRLTQVAAEEFAAARRKRPGAFRHRIELVPGAGHGFDYRPTTPWLAGHRRVVRPRSFSWENFPMGGRYRSGFYNLAVDAPKATDTPSPLGPDGVNHYDGTAPRRLYTMRIEMNTIDLRVEEVSYTVTERGGDWGIPIRFKRTMRPADSGEVRIFLDEKLVDFKRPVRIRVNGKVRFEGRVTPSEESIAQALDLFHDPLRLYPACVKVKWCSWGGLTDMDKK